MTQISSQPRLTFVIILTSLGNFEKINFTILIFLPYSMLSFSISPILRFGYPMAMLF